MGNPKLEENDRVDRNGRSLHSRQISTATHIDEEVLRRDFSVEYEGLSCLAF